MEPGILQNVRLITGLASSRVLGRPLLLSHLVTTRCPCRCETCLWRGLTDPRDELTVREIAAVYADAARCGVRVNSIWGGEPLIREDLPAILEASRRAGLLTVLISSGHRFARRFAEIVPHVDTAIFSLDEVGTAHDAMRGMPRLFEEACAAIEQIRRDAPSIRTYINTVVSRLNVDAVANLASLARRLNSPIYFNPMETGMLGRAGSDSVKRDLALDDEGLSSLARRLIVLKGRRYPVANSYTYLRGFVGGKQKYRCHARKLCLELRPNGDLMDCLNRFEPVANVRRIPLFELLRRPEIRHLRLKDVDCCFCNNANVIDTSNLWAGRLESLYSLVHRNVARA